MKDISPAQLAYDDFLASTFDDSDLNYGNPTNVAKVRTAFFKKKHNPVFEYDNPSIELLKSKEILSSLDMKKTGNKDLHKLQRVYLRKQLIKTDMYLGLGTDDFTKNSKKLFGTPNKALIKNAEEILADKYKPVKGLPKIKATTTMQKLRDGFKELEIKGWNLKRVPMSASASVNVSDRVLKLRSRERFQEPFVKRLIVHEIGTHVVRYENGCLQPLKMLATGTADYLPTEEGLAVYSEKKAGCSSDTQMRNYAGRVMANVYAAESGFVETYKNLVHWFGPKEAFKLALRSKRGISDTSQPGGLTKDHVYLKGYYIVKKFAKKHDIKDLYVGKIGVDEAEMIKKMDFTVEPKYLPSFLKGNCN